MVEVVDAIRNLLRLKRDSFPTDIPGMPLYACTAAAVGVVPRGIIVNWMIDGGGGSVKMIADIVTKESDGQQFYTRAAAQSIQCDSVADAANDLVESTRAHRFPRLLPFI